ncbi:hypothetical protein E0D81_19105 [Lelliottia amnigena]|nr:hypothetical protein E0D81_19105 [Lelliottia amnigena]
MSSFICFPLKKCGLVPSPRPSPTGRGSKAPSLCGREGKNCSRQSPLPESEGVKPLTLWPRGKNYSGLFPLPREKGGNAAPECSLSPWQRGKRRLWTVPSPVGEG